MGYIDLPGPFSRAFSSAFGRVRRVVTDPYRPTRSEIHTLSSGRQVHPLVPRAGQTKNLTHNAEITRSS